MAGQGGGKNEAFRIEFVPHMREIVYYPDEKEIFDIILQGGVSYFVVDKDVHVNKTITTIHNNKIKTFSVNNWNPMFGFNVDETELSILDKVSISSRLIDSKNTFIPTKGYFISVDADDSNFENYIDEGSNIFYVDAKQSIPISPVNIKNLEDVSSFKVLASGWASNCSTFKCKILKPNEVCGRKYINIFIGSEAECQSAVSYYSCKLIWWLVHRFFNISKLNTYSFSFVPDPGKFDHIFTDKELYDKYNLTQEEIAIIESVIKERKQK